MERIRPHGLRIPFRPNLRRQPGPTCRRRRLLALPLWQPSSSCWLTMWCTPSSLQGQVPQQAVGGGAGGGQAPGGLGRGGA